MRLRSICVVNRIIPRTGASEAMDMVLKQESSSEHSV